VEVRVLFWAPKIEGKADLNGRLFFFPVHEPIFSKANKAANCNNRQLLQLAALDLSLSKINQAPNG
jgi:hypothetical protein